MTLGRLLALSLAFGVPLGAALAQEAKTPPPGAAVYFIYPQNGTVVTGGKLWVRMGLRNMGIAPAGIAKDGTGHHHLLLDVDQLPPLDEPIPNDKNHLHFGGGQTEARLEGLTPGKHTLQMMLADESHIPFDPPVVSEKITITVR